jgi:hypothetical protein
MHVRGEQLAIKTKQSFLMNHHYIDLSSLSLLTALRLSTRSLPMNVWTRILGHLDMSRIKTARLFCSARRMASIPYIASLPFERCPNSEDSLRRCLGVFPFVASIALSIQLPEQAKLIDLPAVRSELCKLRLYLPPACTRALTEGKARPRIKEAYRSLNDIITVLKDTTTLTSLELRVNLCDQFSHVPHTCLSFAPNGLGKAVLGLTSLRTLHVSPAVIFPWNELLENPTRLTHPGCLGAMPITLEGLHYCHRAVFVNDVAALTSSRVSKQHV